MTWTCEKCKVTAYDPACWKCGDPRPAGLSEEERAVLPRIRQWAGDMCANGGLSAGRSEMLVRRAAEDFSEATKAARSPLEAENRRLEARVKELEAERDGQKQLAGALAEQVQALAAWRDSSKKQHLKWDAVCRLADKLPRALGREYQEIITEVIEAQLAQSQKPADPLTESADDAPKCKHGHPWYCSRCGEVKPAVPAGLPEVGEPKIPYIGEVIQAKDDDGKWFDVTVDSPAKFMATENFAGDRHEYELRMDQHGVDWRRLPPAQTSQEPAALIEVTTKNLDRYLQNVTLAHALPNRLREFVSYDIRENLERARARANAEHEELWKEASASLRAEATKDKARIAELEGQIEKLLVSLESEKVLHIDDFESWVKTKGELRAEVERLKGELARASGYKRLYEAAMAELARVGGKDRSRNGGI